MAYNIALLGISLILYIIAAGLYLWSLHHEALKVGRAGETFTWFALATHGSAMLYTILFNHQLPYVNLFGSFLFTAWVMVAIFLIVGWKYRISGLGAFVCLVTIIVIASALLLPKGISEQLIPQLQNHWSNPHIISILISYASFALAFGAAFSYMLLEHLLKSKRIGAVQQHLPPLDTVDRLAYKLATFGFFTLTIGIITGAMWAQTAWGSYWNWDPKETWSLITWLVYAVYLHMRVVQGWQGKWANRLLIIGFACVLITYLAVSLLLPGLHSYKW